VSRLRSTWWLAVVVLLLVFLMPMAASGQETEEGNGCMVLCTPELDVEPTLTVENLFAPPRVEEVSSGDITRLERELAFEAILALGVPTELPYVGLTLEAIFAPFADDNDLEFETELNLIFLREEWTGGWFEGHFDVVDQFSPARRPGTDRAYTHKLGLRARPRPVALPLAPAGALAPQCRGWRPHSTTWPRDCRVAGTLWGASASWATRAGGRSRLSSWCPSRP